MVDSDMDKWIDASYATTINNLIGLLDKKLEKLDGLTDQFNSSDEIKFGKLLEILINTATDKNANAILQKAIKLYNNYHIRYQFEHPRLEKLYVNNIKNALAVALPASIALYENFNVQFYSEAVKKRNLINTKPIINSKEYKDMKAGKKH